MAVICVWVCTGATPCFPSGPTWKGVMVHVPGATADDVNVPLGVEP